VAVTLGAVVVFLDGVRGGGMLGLNFVSAGFVILAKYLAVVIHPDGRLHVTAGIVVVELLVVACCLASSASLRAFFLSA